MQKTVQYLYLYFTKDDQDLLAWANMIKENNLGLSTWIQAILVSEAAKEKLDIGAVHIPSAMEPIKMTTTPKLWGDDTKNERTKIVPGWHIRGENGKLVAGTVLPVKITRSLAQEALSELKKRHRKIAAYVKAIIRRDLEILPAGPDLPPNKNTAIDLFALCEDKIGKNSQPQRDKNKQFRQRQENRNIQNTKPSQQRQERTDKNGPQQTYPPTPKPGQSEQNERKTPALRNPLLDQIN